MELYPHTLSWRGGKDGRGEKGMGWMEGREKRGERKGKGMGRAGDGRKEGEEGKKYIVPILDFKRPLSLQ